MISSITSKGQTTIPKDIREHLKVSAGDRIKFFVHPDGSVAILPVIPVAALKGVLKSRVGRVTLEQMNEAKEQGATSRVQGRRSK